MVTRILALDVGEKRIGLAISEGLGVWPLKTLLRKNLEEDLAELIKIIKEEATQTLVVGLPYNMDGTEGAQAKKIRNFISQLKNLLIKESHQRQKRGEGEAPSALPMEGATRAPMIEWSDERLTSWEAEQRLTQGGLKGKKRKKKVDELAACLILEDYLAGHRQEGL
jgi:putative Holliday junction resolvase